jgi:outer membrane protein assembly factor BamB
MKPAHRILLTLTGLLLACSLAAAQTATVAKGDPKAPLGTPGFVPSPERPIGWRGDGSGRFPGATPPIKWARSAGARPESSGILWMAPIPPGGSSPIVVGDRIYVGFDPYGLLCYSKTDGHILWYRTHHYYEIMPEEQRKTIDDVAKPLYIKIKDHFEAELKRMSNSVSVAGFPDTQRFMNWQWSQQVEAAQKQLDAAVTGLDPVRYKIDKNSWEFAAATPVTDGKYIYMWFANRIAVCYDLDGNRQWLTNEPAMERKMGEHGHHSSPVIVGNEFITQYAADVIAFDRKTGKHLWTREMKGVPWATPTYSSLNVTAVDGAPYVVSARGEAYRAVDGELGWGPFKDYGGENTTPIVESGRIFLWDRGAGLVQLLIPASPGPKALCSLGKSLRKDALKSGGKDPYMVASPLMVNGLVYFVTDTGLLRVFDPVAGTLLYEKPLPLDSHIEYVWFPGFASSPALGGKYIYLMDNQGGTVVLEPGREYKEIAVNKIITPEKKNRDKGGAETTVNEQTVANPFFDGKMMFVRGQQYLYCIGSR